MHSSPSSDGDAPAASMHPSTPVSVHLPSSAFRKVHAVEEEVPLSIPPGPGRPAPSAQKTVWPGNWSYTVGYVSKPEENLRCWEQAAWGPGSPAARTARHAAAMIPDRIIPARV